jgi:hypothetical protein
VRFLQVIPHTKKVAIEIEPEKAKGVEIYLLDVSTGKSVLLAKNEKHRKNAFLGISPDQSRVFVNENEDAISLNLDGSDKRTFGYVFEEDKLFFSKDGKRVLLGSYGLTSAKIDGSDAKVLVKNETTSAGAVEWTFVSQENAVLALGPDQNGLAELLRLDIEPGVSTSVLQTQWDNIEVNRPVASPDGKELLFFVHSGDKLRLYRYAMGDKGFTLLGAVAKGQYPIESLGFGSSKGKRERD